MSSPLDVFLDPEAGRINHARLAHLASLSLDLDHKRVLEVGAGIGLLTEFFERRGCDVLSTDGAPSNVAEMMRRWPQRRLGVLDLDYTADLGGLGMFEIVFCYGTLYHLRDADGALARLAAVCSGVILLETVVSRGSHSELNPVVEPPIANQAVSGIGCRPTRPWVMSALRRHLGHAYTTLDQPDYPDFVTDWSIVGHNGNLRAVFVGSRQALALPTLAEVLPIRHRNAPPRLRQGPVTRVWIDVGAHRGEHSRAAAQDDPCLTVHAFEPLPTLFAELTDSPLNYHVHSMAVGEQDGMAAFHINRFDAASSLLRMDEAARTSWTDGDLLGAERTIQVQVTRLDSFMHRQGIGRVEFLKVDAQGGDLATLRSAGDRLADIDRIQLEVAVTPRQLYEGAADKPTILAYMAAHGFRLTETQAQSHGQEENLTFLHADAATQHGAQTAPAGNGNTHVAGLYDFAEAKIAHGQVSQIGDMLEATTDLQPWAYAVMVPIGTAFRGGDTGRYEVELAVQVDRGVVQIGILNSAEDHFPSAVSVAATSAWQSVTLVTPPLHRAGPLVIRNAADPGPSRARCRIVAVTRLAIVVPTVEDMVEASPPLAEAELLAAQIQACAEALAPMTAGDPALALAMAPRVVDSAMQLRRSLASGGQGLIALTIDSLASVFAPLTGEELARLATALATIVPLHPIPGWRTDSFLESGELATFVRYAIWLALRRHEEATHVILPWHAGTRLELDLRNDLGQAVFVAGCYEPNEFALLDRVLRQGMTVLDGGANEGAYTLFLAARVGEAGRVIAVEPSPRELQRLRTNITLNGITQVKVGDAVLADQVGEVELLVAEITHAGQNTLGGFMYPGVSAAGSVSVLATTIDELAEAQKLTALDIVKLDLEGAELRALAGARETLRRWRPLLLFEAAQAALAQQGGSLEDLLSLLTDCGYQVLSMDPSTGLPTLIGSMPLSDNLVAVHPRRDWGLLSD